MHTFELKTVIAAEPQAVFAALTEPRYILQWDYCRWVQHDARLAGKVRKRDDEQKLWEGEIVAFQPPFRYAVLGPVAVDMEEEEAGQFLVRFDYQLDSRDLQTLLTLRAEGFPTEDLMERERNSWGGYFLEKLKKVAEKIEHN